jgi:hypothetical protein
MPSKNDLYLINFSAGLLPTLLTSREGVIQPRFNIQHVNLSTFQPDQLPTSYFVPNINPINSINPINFINHINHLLPTS